MMRERAFEYYADFPSLLVVVDRKGVVLAASETFLESVGYDRNELEGISLSDIATIDPIAHDRIVCFHEFLGTSQCRGIPAQITARSGKKLHVLMSSKVRRTGKALDQHIVVFEDTTLHEEAVEALRESEARLRLSVRGSRIGFWEWQVDDDTFIFSHRWAEILGYEENELRQQWSTWKSRLHPEDRERVLAQLDGHLQSDLDSLEIEHRLKHKNGTWVWVLGIGRVTERKPDGTPIRLNGILQDIDQRKTAAQEVSQQLHESSTLIQLSRTINSSLTIDEVLQAAIKGIVSPIEPAVTTIYLAENDELTLRKWYSWDPDVIGDPEVLSRIGSSLCHKAFETGEKIYTDNLPDDSPDSHGQSEHIIHGFAALPLSFGETPLGAMGIGCATTRNFQQYDEYLTNLATVVSLGLNNALLHDKLQRHVMDLENTIMVRANELASANRQLLEEIEERKQMEQEVLKREAMLNITGSMVKAGGWELDIASQKLIWTKAVYDIHEVDFDFIPNMDTALDFYQADFRERIVALVERCINTGHPYDEELEIVTAKGRTVPVRAKGEAVFEDGTVVKLIGSFQDISYQKRQESELKRFRTALDASDDAIFIVDPTSWKILDANMATGRMFDFSLNEIQSMGPLDLGLDMDNSTLSSLLDAAARTRKPHSFEAAIQTKDKVTVPLELQLTGYEEDGKDLVVGVARDITARVEAQQAILKAKSEAERASMAKTDFLSRVSHEIRTPLNHITGLSDHALSGGSQSHQEKTFRKIHASATKLLGILNEIINFSKLEKGEFALAQTPFDLRELVQFAYATAKEKAHERKLDIQYSFAPTVNQYRVGDHTSIMQILDNLLDNAVKFTPQGGISLLVEGDDHEIRMAVSDTGIGIPQEKLDIIFDSFVQGESSVHRRRFGGTGLGVTVAKQLAELMDGTLTVQSQENVGTRFELRLPLATTDASHVQPIRHNSDNASHSFESSPLNGTLLSPEACDAAIELLTNINTKLDHGSIDEEALAEASDILESAIGAATLDALTEALDNFDFSQAQKTIRQLIEKIHIIKA